MGTLFGQWGLTSCQRLLSFISDVQDEDVGDDKAKKRSVAKVNVKFFQNISVFLKKVKHGP